MLRVYVFRCDKLGTVYIYFNRVLQMKMIVYSLLKHACFIEKVVGLTHLITRRV